QAVLSEMMHDLRDVPAAVARGILDLLADLRERLALPRHLDGREVPLRMARYVRRVEVRHVMAGLASHAWRAMTVGTGHDQRLMRPPRIGLQRAVTRRVTVHAPRMLQHLAHPDKERLGSRTRVRDARESRHWSQ